MVFENKRIGIKFSPALFNSGIIRPDSTTLQTYAYILEKLGGYGLGHLQLVGPSVDRAGTALEQIKTDYFVHFRRLYKAR